MTNTAVRTSWIREHAWLRVVLHHARGNILTAEMVAGLREVVAALDRERGLKLVTLEGEGDHFSFGASVAEHAPGEIERVLPDIHRLVFDLLRAPAITAALVRGRCLGGGFELALACDFVFAADDAMLGLPEIVLGVFPPAGAALLPPRVGVSRAAQAVLTGEARPAVEWQQAGLVSRVVPAPRLQAEVEEWFDRHLAPRSAAALRYAVQAARGSLRAHVERHLPELERLYLEDLMKTHDAPEGIAAFLEKRPPRWEDE